MTSRRWCFTLNNYTEEEYEALVKYEAVYKVIGKEVGQQGTPHLQGFIILPRMFRLSAMKKISSRAHWEIARGTSEEAARYCKKDGDYVEQGECPLTPGLAEQTRWAEAKKRAREGDLDGVPADIYIRYYRTLKDIKKDHMAKPADADDVTGVWIWGRAGCGKSRKARTDYSNAYMKMQNKWWDGYQDEEYVILDDFDSKELGHLLKIWADRYPFVGETKGGAIYIRPKKFVVTSNYAPDDVKFGWDLDTQEAIKRRFTVIHMC